MIRDYLEKHYNQILDKVRAVTRNHQFTEDLLQDCILSFLEKGSDYTTKVLNDDKVQHYIVRMAHIQFNSSTSPFYMKYKRGLNKSVEVDNLEIEDNVFDKEEHEDTEKLSDEIKLYIGNLPIYERTIADKHFINGTSQREISRFYGINRIHISRDLKTVQKNIKIKFNRDDYRTH